MTADAAEVERVITAALADFTDRGHRGVVVDSPPGAGKSTLVVRAATQIARGDEPVMVIAQTNEQVDDLVDRMAGEAPTVRVGRLSAHGYVPTARVTHPNVSVADRVQDLHQPQITVGTAAKWMHVTAAHGALCPRALQHLGDQRGDRARVRRSPRPPPWRRGGRPAAG